MTAVASRFTISGDVRCFAGEALTVELAFDTAGTLIDQTGREWAWTVYRANDREPLFSAAGEVVSVGDDHFVRFAIDGDTTDELFARNRIGLRHEMAEVTAGGRDVWVEGQFSIARSAVAVSPAPVSATAGSVTRFVFDYQTRRVTISPRGAPGMPVWQALGLTQEEYDVSVRQPALEAAADVAALTLDLGQAFSQQQAQVDDAIDAQDAAIAAGLEAEGVARSAEIDGKVNPLAAATDYRYASRTAVAAATIPAVAQQVVVTGWAIFADALKSTWRRVSAQPAHPARFRSQDRFLPDGSTDAVNGGWWELYENIVRPEWLANPSDTKAGLPLARDAALALGVPLELLGRTYAAPDDFDWKTGRRSLRIRGAGGGLTQVRQSGTQWSKVLRFEGDATWWQLARSGTANVAAKTIVDLDVTGIAIGNAVIGEFVQDGTLITAIGANSITLSVAPLVDGAIEIVVRQAIETRPQLHISGVTFGRDNAATYQGGNTQHTLSADYFSVVRFDDLTIDGSIGWGATAAFCEDVQFNNVRVSNSRGGKGGGTGTDGLNIYKSRFAKIINAYVINVGDDPCSIGSYDKAWYVERAEILGSKWLACTGSGKFYGLVRNYTSDGNVGAFCSTGGQGAWNDRSGTGAGNMPKGAITNNTFWFCGTTGSAGGIFLFNSNGIVNDPLSYIKDVSILGNKCYGGQYGLSISSEDNVLSLKRTRNVTVRGNIFSGQTIDAIRVYGIDGYLTIEGNELYSARGRFGFIKFLGDRTRVSIRNNIFDGCLSSPPAAAPVGLLISTGKDVLLNVEGNKFRGNKRGLFTDAVRTENTTLHPRSTNDNDVDASFSTPSQLVGSRGSALAVVRGLATLPTTAGHTVHDDQVLIYTQAATNAAPGASVKVGGTRGTLFAADGATAVTATTTAGSPLVQVSDATNIFPGCFLAIAGVTITGGSGATAARLPVSEVNGNMVTLPAPVNEAVAGAATSYFAPTLLSWPTSSGGSVTNPWVMEGNAYVLNLDSRPGAGHSVADTFSVRLATASSQIAKIRFSDIWIFTVEWMITRVDDPKTKFYYQEVISLRSTQPSTGAQGVDWVQQVDSTTPGDRVYAERTAWPSNAVPIGALPGTLTLTCPTFGAPHAPAELTFTPNPGSNPRDFTVTATIRANKSGGN